MLQHWLRRATVHSAGVGSPRRARLETTGDATAAAVFEPDLMAAEEIFHRHFVFIFM
jgi:hypothetical protein